MTFRPSAPARLRSLATAGTVLLLSCFLSCSKDPAKARAEYIQSGLQYFDQKQYREASIQFRNAVQADPNSVDAHYQLARAYVALGQFQEGYRELLRTVSLDPNHNNAQLLVGDFLLLDRKFDDARAKAELILKKDPRHVAAHILLGNSYARILSLNDGLAELHTGFQAEPKLSPSFYDLGSDQSAASQLETAETSFRSALGVDARSVPAHLGLANYYLSRRKNAEAAAEVKAALEIAPDAPDVLGTAAYHALVLRNFPEAEKYYSRLVQVSNNSEAARIILSDFYALTGQQDRSIQILEALTRDVPAGNNARKRLANTYVARREFDKAQKIVDEILKHNATEIAALVFKGRLLLLNNKPQEAVAELEGVAKKVPNSAMVRYFLGLAYAQAQNRKQAEAELEQSIKNDPNFALGYLALAQLKVDVGDVDGAVQKAQEALRLDPGSADARLLLGVAYGSKGDYRSARAELEEYTRRNPASPAGFYRLGTVFLGLGDIPQAEAHLENSLKLDPNQVDALAALTNLYVRQNRSERAVARLTQEIAKQPAEPRLYELLGQVYISQKNLVKAEEQFRKVASLAPANSNQQTILADFYTATGNEERGIAVYLEDGQGSTRQPESEEAPGQPLSEPA